MARAHLHLDCIAALALATAGLMTATAGGNLLNNPDFEDVGPNGTFTSFTGGPGGAGSAAAAGWGVFHNTPGTTTTELVPAELPFGGTNMIHVVTDGMGNGLTNVFGGLDAGPDCIRSSVWVYVVSGEVYIGTGNGGNTTNEAQTITTGTWERVFAEDNICPANEFIIYAAGPGGGEFYVDTASVEVGPCHCPYDYDGDETAGVPDLLQLLSEWGGEPSCGHDIDGDNVVGTSDLLDLLAAWGAPCGCAPPPNDICGQAVAIAAAPAVTIPFCTTGAASDGPMDVPCEGFFYSGIDHDIWYTVTAPADGAMRLDTCGSQFDTKIAVYHESPVLGACCPGALFPAVLVACNDDEGCGEDNYQGELTVPVVGGDCYRIRVGGYSGWSGEGVLNVRMIGDEPEDCIPIDAACGFSCIDTVFGSTTHATGTTDDSDCASNDTVDQWYCYTVNCNTIPLFTEFSTCNPGTNFDTTLTVYTYFFGQFSEVACNDDFADPACENEAGLNRKSRVVVDNLVEGLTYYIRVSGYNGAVGDYELTVNTQCVPQ